MSRLTFPQLADRLRVALFKQGAHPTTIIASVLRRVRQTVRLSDVRTSAGVHVYKPAAGLLAACYSRRIPDYDGGEVRIAEGKHADDLLAQFDGRLYAAFGTSEREPLLAVLQRASVGGALDSNYAFALYRTLELLEIDLTCETPTSPYDSLFASAYGCSAAEYLSIIVSMWQCAAEKGDFLDRSFLAASPIGDRLALVADRVFAQHSCRIADVKQRIDDELRHHGLEGLVAAFFAKYPFLAIRKNFYMPAPHPYVRVFAMTAPLFRMLELARERAGIPDPKESVDVGKRFESMVAHVASFGFASSQIVVEHESGTKKHPRRSSDLILFEEAGAIIVEAKITRLARDSFFGFSLPAFREDLKKIKRAICQPISYLAWLDVAREDQLSPEGRRTKARLGDAKRIFILGLFAALPPIFHVDPFRRMLYDEIHADLTDAEREWLRRNVQRLAGWHVLDIEDLALFVGRDRPFGLHEGLCEYLALPALTAPVTAEWMPPSFSDYVRSRGGSVRLAQFDARIREFLMWSGRYAFGDSFMTCGDS